MLEWYIQTQFKRQIMKGHNITQGCSTTDKAISTKKTKRSPDKYIPHRRPLPAKNQSENRCLCPQISINTNLICLNYRNQETHKRMSAEQIDTSVANFIQKSFQILQNKDYQPIIHWMANGREFAIKEIDDFQDQILPKFFRHRNINSFIRQLNMYGFHKSRKDPSKNIFSHPFFLRAQPQILHLVKRKIKNQDKMDEENKAPVPPSTPAKKPTELLEPATEIVSKKSLQSSSALKESPPVKQEKETAPTKTEIAGPFSMLSLKSFGMGLINEKSPFKNMIEKSAVMDSNPQLYLKMRDHNSIGQMDIMLDDDDNLSIEDEIEKDRRVFQNRRSGVSILQTYNLLEDFDFRR